MAGSKLNERSVRDENFAHCVSLLPFTTGWAENLDKKYRPSDALEVRNMIHIPCEVLWAFVKDYGEKDGGPVGRACRDAIDQLEKNRVIFARSA